MANEREITIRIAAKNLTAAEFAKARAEVLGLDETAAKAKAGGASLGPAFSVSFAAIAAGAAAAVAAVGAVAGVIGVMGAHGSEVADVRQHFDLLNQAAGSTGQTMLGVLRTALKGTVSDLDIMKATNQAMGQGLKLTETQFALTAQASRVLADRVGGDTKTAYDTLLTAMATGQDRQLKGIGLNIDAEAAVKAHAAALGIEASQMTEAEQQAAKRDAILQALSGTLAQTGEAEVDLADLIDQGSVALSNMWDRMSEGVATSPVLAAAFGPIANAVREAFGPHQDAIIKAIVTTIENAAYVVIDLGEATLGMADSFVRSLFWMEAKLSGFAAAALELAAKLPGASAEVKAQAAEMRQHAQDSQRAADGQNMFSQVVGRLRQGLTEAKTAMLEARAAQVEQAATAGTASAANERAASAQRQIQVTADAAAPAVARLTKEQKAAQKAAEELEREIRKLNEQNLSLYEMVNRGMFGTFTTELKDTTSLVSRSNAETGQARAEALQWATANGAVLAPSIKAVGTTLKDAAADASTFRKDLAAAFTDLPTIILGAIQGGGSIWKAAGGHIGTTLMEGFVERYGPAIEAALPFGLGKAITAFLPTLGALFGPVAEKIGGFFRSIFGGPSDAEKDGRRRVAEFEAQLRSTLTETQRLEAGTDEWKQTVVAVRDAYLAAGRTEAEALAAVERLWKSSKKGAGEVEAAMAAIDAVLKATGSTTVGFVDQVIDRVNRIPREIEIEVNGVYNAPEIEGGRAGYATGTKGAHGRYFVDFGSGTDTRLHGVEAVLTPHQAPGFVATWLANNMNGAAAPAGAAPNVYILVEKDGAPRAVSEAEFRRRELNAMLRSGVLSVPLRAVGATV